MASPGKRYKPEQIVTILREIDVKTVNGITIPEACKQAGISEQTYSGVRYTAVSKSIKPESSKK